MQIINIELRLIFLAMGLSAQAEISDHGSHNAQTPQTQESLYTDTSKPKVLYEPCGEHPVVGLSKQVRDCASKNNGKALVFYKGATWKLIAVSNDGRRRWLNTKTNEIQSLSSEIGYQGCDFDQRRNPVCTCYNEGSIGPCGNFVNANLRSASFPSRTDLSGSIFQGAKMSDFGCDGCILDGANLQRADLRRANLNQIHAQKANFTDSDLTQARLANADLVWAKLTHTIALGTDLRGSNLRFANLSQMTYRSSCLGSPSSGSGLECTYFQDAWYNPRTTLPPNFNPTQAGMLRSNSLSKK